MLSNTEAELKKSVAYKKKRVWLFCKAFFSSFFPQKKRESDGDDDQSVKSLPNF